MTSSRCDTWIYGIRFGDYLKVGVSTNPGRRLRALPAGVRLPDGFDMAVLPEPIFAVDGGYDTERLLHTILEDHRAIGEWYHWEPVAKIMDRLLMSAEFLSDVFGQPDFDLPEPPGDISQEDPSQPLPPPIIF